MSMWPLYGSQSSVGNTPGVLIEATADLHLPIALRGSADCRMLCNCPQRTLDYGNGDSVCQRSARQNLGIVGMGQIGSSVPGVPGLWLEVIYQTVVQCE